MSNSGSETSGAPQFTDPLNRVVVKMMALYGPDVPVKEDVLLARDIVLEIVALARAADGPA